MRQLVCFALLLLAGCTNWNERSAAFADLAAFKAGPYGGDGHLPSNLLPPSARDIRYRYNIDSTETEASFSFASADAERVIAPFRNSDQIRLHQLELEGSLPPSKVLSPLLIRCAGNHVEFLQVTEMSSARYWTSVDPKVRGSACTTVSSTTPLI